jgi:hypothetical protein
MTSNNDETTKEIVSKGITRFQEVSCGCERYKKRFFQWCEKHEYGFPVVCFLIKQILKIVGSQIETECIFSLAGI